MTVRLSASSDALLKLLDGLCVGARQQAFTLCTKFVVSRNGARHARAVTVMSTPRRAATPAAGCGSLGLIHK